MSSVRLIGVGVGPGDPELVTLKAVRALSSADAVLVPATEARGPGAGRAHSIVAHVAPHARIVSVPFSMADTTGVTPRRRQAWADSARAALDEFAAGATTVAFATVGDPCVYSTFSYLAAAVRAELPQVDIEVIPGITAMQATAAASATPLVEGTEVLALVPFTAGPQRLAALHRLADTVVVYKAGRRLSEVLAELAAEPDESDGGDACDGGEHRQVRIGVDVSLPQQQLFSPEEAMGASAPYFCTVLATPTRTTPGGRL